MSLQVLRRIGLSLAFDLSLTHIDVESDSELAIHALSQSGTIRSMIWEYGSIILKQFFLLFFFFFFFSLHLMKRFCNLVAHSLANIPTVVSLPAFGNIAFPFGSLCLLIGMFPVLFPEL